MNQRCRCCDALLEESTTTFTVVKRVIVYVVENAPCWKCPNCEEVVFDQNVAEELSKYASGRVASTKRPLVAVLFHWDDPAVEVWQPLSVQTANAPVGELVGTQNK